MQAFIEEVHGVVGRSGRACMPLVGRWLVITMLATQLLVVLVAQCKRVACDPRWSGLVSCSSDLQILALLHNEPAAEGASQGHRDAGMPHKVTLRPLTTHAYLSP